jgi:predicted transcriptional regulator of viral defense system
MPVVADMPDTFTTTTAFSRGVHPRDLYAWRDAGDIVELSRGVFRRADAPLAAHPDLLAVSYRAPSAIVCCVSAAVVHELTDEQPVRVQVAVANGTHPPRIDHPPTRVFRFDPRTFELGVTGTEVAQGERVRVYDAARTVVDLMRLRHRMGESLAHTALNRYVDRPDGRSALLLDYARELGVLGPMRRALDVVSAR